MSKSANFADLKLPVSALYLLAAPSTSEKVREEVLERAKAGEAMSLAEVKEIISDHEDEDEPEDEDEVEDETEPEHLAGTIKTHLEEGDKAKDEAEKAATALEDPATEPAPLQVQRDDDLAEHAMGPCPLVIMLLRLNFLESERRRHILDGGRLARIHVFRNRLQGMHRVNWTGPRASS